MRGSPITALRMSPQIQSGFQWPSDSNTPSISGSTLTYYPNVPNSYAPATTTLTSSGFISTSSNGQVIQDLDITGGVFVNHNDVTIRRCRISGYDYFGVDASPGQVAAGHTLFIEDCLFDTPSPRTGPLAGNSSTAVVGSNWTQRRCRIKDCDNGSDVEDNVLIEYCFLGYFYNGGQNIGQAAHADGLQTGSGSSSSNVTFQHNTVWGMGYNDSAVLQGTNSCTWYAPGTTTFTNMSINHNFVAGGGFSIYFNDTIAGKTTNVSVTNNHVSTLFFPNGGEFGPWSSVVGNATISGNVMVDANDNFISNLTS